MSGIDLSNPSNFLGAMNSNANNVFGTPSTESIKDMAKSMEMDSFATLMETVDGSSGSEGHSLANMLKSNQQVNDDFMDDAKNGVIDLKNGRIDLNA
jgi:hypothetical protein